MSYSRSSSFGQVYFCETSPQHYAFQERSPEMTPQFVPNEIIGVFAFRKELHAMPVIPVLV
jgi:hypothetical protein